MFLRFKKNESKQLTISITRNITIFYLHYSTLLKVSHKSLLSLNHKSEIFKYKFFDKKMSDSVLEGAISESEKHLCFILTPLQKTKRRTMLYIHYTSFCLTYFCVSHT